MRRFITSRSRMSTPSPANPFHADRLNRSSNYRPEWDVPSINKDVSDAILGMVCSVRGSTETRLEQKVPVLTGTAGFGKTHLFGRLAHQLKDEAFFVFVPQLEEGAPPVAHLQYHLVEALFDSPSGAAPPLHKFLARLCLPSFASYFDSLPASVAEQHQGLQQR